MPNANDRENIVYVRFASREKERLAQGCAYMQLKQTEYIRKAVEERLDRDLERERGERGLRALRARQDGLDFHAMSDGEIRRVLRDIGWTGNPLANDT
jgi:hypothetical protein